MMASLMCVLFLCAVGVALAENRENNLMRSLLQQYGINSRPGAVDAPLVVNFGLVLVQIVDFDVEKQSITTAVWHAMKWTDERLRWNPNNYHGLQQLSISPKLIWTPDIVLYNTISPMTPSADVNVLVKKDGTVMWYPVYTHTSSCKTDLNSQQHNCTLKFGSWTLSGNILSLRGMGHNVDLNQYVPNHMWDLDDSRLTTNRRHYPCCREAYYDVSFTLHLNASTANGKVKYLASTSGGGRVSLTIVAIVTIVLNMMDFVA